LSTIIIVILISNNNYIRRFPRGRNMYNRIDYDEACVLRNPFKK